MKGQTSPWSRIDKFKYIIKTPFLPYFPFSIPCLLSILHFKFALCGGKVIDNDRGVHMRPMPGMVGLISSTSKVHLFSAFTFIVFLNFRVRSMIL